MTHSRLIVAIDTPDLGHAKTLAGLVGPHCGMLKLGLEFFAAQGAAGVRAITGRPVFLDLKLHDIPNTVAGAVRGLLPLAPAMLTVHAAGGTPMIAAARQAAGDGEGRPLLLAVTVLTSLDAEALAETGVEGMPVQQAVRLARLALAAGGMGWSAVRTRLWPCAPSSGATRSSWCRASVRRRVGWTISRGS